MKTLLALAALAMLSGTAQAASFYGSPLPSSFPDQYSPPAGYLPTLPGYLPTLPGYVPPPPPPANGTVFCQSLGDGFSQCWR